MLRRSDFTSDALWSEYREGVVENLLSSFRKKTISEIPYCPKPRKRATSLNNLCSKAKEMPRKQKSHSTTSK